MYLPSLCSAYIRKFHFVGTSVLDPVTNHILVWLHPDAFVRPVCALRDAVLCNLLMCFWNFHHHYRHHHLRVVFCSEEKQTKKCKKNNRRSVHSKKITHLQIQEENKTQNHHTVYSNHQMHMPTELNIIAIDSPVLCADEFDVITLFVLLHRENCCRLSVGLEGSIFISISVNRKLQMPFKWIQITLFREQHTHTAQCNAMKWYKCENFQIFFFFAGIIQICTIVFVLLLMSCRQWNFTIISKYQVDKCVQRNFDNGNFNMLTIYECVSISVNLKTKVVNIPIFINQLLFWFCSPFDIFFYQKCSFGDGFGLFFFVSLFLDLCFVLELDACIRAKQNLWNWH